MRCLSTVLLTFLGCALAGCNKEAPPPQKGGVSITAPGVSVDVGGPSGGVKVKAPGAEVNVPPAK